MAKSLDKKIIAALTADESPLRDEGIELTIDYILDLRVDALIEPETTRNLIYWVVTGSNAELLNERHLLPGWERGKARFEESGETIRDLVPEDVLERLDEILTNAPIPKARWAKDAVDPALVRKLMAPVVQETLMSFTKRLPIPGLSGDSGSSGSRGGSSGSLGGIAGRLRKSASGVLDAGKSLLGDLEERIQASAKEFSATAMTDARNALRERLKSDEGKELISEIRRQFFDTLLGTSIHDLNEDLYKLPIDEILALGPPLIDFNRERPPVIDALDEEIAAFMAVEGERSLREILTELDIINETREAIRQEWDPLVIDFFGSDAFSAWVGKLVAL